MPDREFEYDVYRCYTERASGTLNAYTAEELVKEFYDPQAVQEVLEKYVK